MTTRKDCDIKTTRSGRAVALACALILACGSDAMAGSIRLWPTAVVVSDSVRLDDIAELRGFSSDAATHLSGLTITGSPVAGGTRIVPLDLVRSVLTTSGENMAFITVSGATECVVSRPSALIAPNHQSSAPKRSAGSIRPAVSSPDSSRTTDRRTLRQAVVDYCNEQVSRYHATAEVTFDRTSDQVLELAEPEYDFRVRSRSNSPAGLVPLEVDVLAGDRVVQTVPLVVRVIVDRHVVVARRTINQDASIGASDLDIIELSFDRVDDIGVTDANLAIGQRAKRLIPAGTPIQPDMLEPVPVVLRGQLVTLTSMAGSVSVVTTAKAAANGLIGDVIKVRSVEDRSVEFDAVVIGPGHVRIGTPAGFQVANGGGS
jgi:flagella basal body P-ring formation protein FlgA